jgi:membrane fusion protein, multidrug efflux system
VTLKRSSKIVGLVLFSAGLLGLVAGGYYWFVHRGTKEIASRPAPIPVSVTVASRQDVPIYVSGLGTVQALNTVPVHSQVDGKLIEITFTEGERVKKGDVLAKIDPRLFQAALDQAIAKRGQDEANLVSVAKDLTRAKALVAKSFETQQVVDQQQAKVDALRAAIAADAAAIESAETQLDYTIITSPIDSRAGIRQIDIGNIIHASDQTPLTILTQTQPASVIFTLTASLLDRLRKAIAQGPVQVTAYDQDNVEALATGKLLLIDGTIDQATSTMKLKAQFANEDERLWPGAFVNARVLLEMRTNVVTVPASTVQRGPRGLFVWVVGADGTAQMKPIEVGPPTDVVTIVMKGVNEGENVVSDGVYKLQPGSRVAVTSSTAPPAHAAAPAAAATPAMARNAP